MSFETIELNQQGPVAIITLNRPEKLNAINKTMLLELEAALDQIGTNDSVYTVVLNGNGRSFCSGFDLQSGVDANRKGEAEWRAAIEYDFDVIMRFWHFPKPTIAVVQGYALAGGFELALACDMTICEENSLFGEPEVRFGSSIVALLMPWYTSPKHAKQMLLSGETRMSAAEALNIGIVNEVVAVNEGLGRGLALAGEVALMDPDSVRLTKQAINQSYEIMGMSKALAMGVDISVQIETTETPMRRQFNQVLRDKGMKAALAWREGRLKRS
ncbi:MAG: enoyl-CoA hydratase/isomerase family protein [Gammaproteobacteria bacterium]|nr:enoyl-CoA hydratase/isomerase family protein [Gammaproteobacteria bacterium]